MSETTPQKERAESAGLDYLSRIISEIQTTPQETKESVQQGAKSPDILSNLLSNPELLSKLPALLSTVKPLMEMLSSTPAASVNPKPVERQSEERHTPDRRAALLCAIKPYLNSDRCRTIDYIIKLSRLGDILKTL